MNNNELNEIKNYFGMDFDIKPFGEGHINDTYITDSTPRYSLQRINHNVFKKPDEVMENIIAVTEFLKKKITAEGLDASRRTLHFLSNSEGGYLCKTKEGNYYRMYEFIDDVVTYQLVEDPKTMYHAAKAFGKFQKYLGDFPAAELNETIPNFHNTVSRFNDLKVAIEANLSGRKDNIPEEIKFALDRENDTKIILNTMAKGDIPMRVTHNDTKLNNVLMDIETGEGICVIDLDTVMPGSMLYDFGDALRFGTNTAEEDETDLSKVSCNLEIFEQFTKGFLEELENGITKKEAELLAFSARLMTYECGIRFLTDYLNGDTYFKTEYPDHNLDRARNQFKLVADMEAKSEEMEKIVKKYL